MKKLLAIVLVLGLASIASAGAYLSASNPKPFQGEVITISLLADVAVSGVGSATISATGGSAALGSLPAGWVAAYLPWQSNGTLVNAGGVLISGVDGGAGFGVPNADAGAAIYAFSYVAPMELGTYTINFSGSLTNASAQVMEPVQGLNVEVIPEPITMSLLGLGGLVALRRRMA